MCNDYEQHVRWAEYYKMMQELELGIPTQQTELDLPQADDVRINDQGPIMRGAGNLVELCTMSSDMRKNRNCRIGRPIKLLNRSGLLIQNLNASD